MIEQIIVAFFASLGFGIIFNIKGKNLIFAAIGGGLSWFFYLFLTQNKISPILSLFIASIIFSIYSEICARYLKTPVTTLVICALIPLVPLNNAGTCVNKKRCSANYPTVSPIILSKFSQHQVFSTAY